MNTTSKILKKITIHFRKRLDGWNFYLMPIERMKIQEFFPHAVFIANITISDETLAEFDALHSSLEKHIIPVLTGLEKEVLEKLEIIFINSKTEESSLFKYG
jgi:hypothetical protein